MNGVPLSDLVAYLDDYLRIGEIPDSAGAVNGLEVENSGSVGSIIAAVDASLQTVSGVAAAAADWQPGRAPLVLVHHGMFWDGNVAVTGRRYRRIRTLMDNDIALYAAHIPLDVHPEVGNNVVLAERLGVSIDGWFGKYQGVLLGVYGQVPSSLADRDTLHDEIARVLDEERGAHARTDRPLLIPGGPEQVRRVGIITGAGGSMIRDALDAGVDTFITGEGAHHTYFDAMEWGVNVFYAGHYATETLGVQALASHLADRFELSWEFHDHPTGL